MIRSEFWCLVLLMLGCAGSASGAGEADLVPISEAAKEGRIGVKNQGSAEAGPSVLSFTCVKIGGGECPQAPGMKDYRNPDYPDKLVVMVPSLQSGQVYIHTFKFWPELKWTAGGYVTLLFADADDKVKESDESNNIAVVYRREGTADLPAPMPSGASPPAAKATEPVRPAPPPPPPATSAPPPAPPATPNP